VEARKGGAEVMTLPRRGKKAPHNGFGKNPNMRLEPYVEACRADVGETKAPLVNPFATGRMPFDWLHRICTESGFPAGIPGFPEKFGKSLSLTRQ